MFHSIKTSKLTKKIRKLAAYAVITSQLLASTHHLLAMELLSRSASPRKVMPEKSLVENNDAALAQIHNEETFQAQHPIPVLPENNLHHEILAGANVDAVDQSHAQASVQNQGIIRHLFRSPSKVVPEVILQNQDSNFLMKENVDQSSAEQEAEHIHGGNRIHPAPASEELPIADDESVDSADERHCNEADLKKFNTYLENNLRQDFSTKDYLLFSGVLIATVLLGYGAKFDNMGEIFAEARMWSDNFFLTFAQSVTGYRFLYMTDENDPFFYKMTEAQEINSYIFLTPYVATRLYAMASYADSCVSTYLPTVHNNRILKGLLYTGAILGGANAGGSLASQYYSNNIAFDGKYSNFADVLTPYILTFYCLDAILTYCLFVQNKVVPETIKYRESKENHQLRKKLSQKLEITKEVLASMNHDEILDQNINPSLDTEGQNQTKVGIQKAQNLLDLSFKQVKNRRYSMQKTTPKPHHQSVMNFLKSKWHYLLGAAIVGSGSFLTFKTNYTNAAAFLNTKFSWNFDKDQFSSMGNAAYQSFVLSAYKVWEHDKQHIEIYNGNGTDWCTQCFNSAKFSVGNETEGGVFTFKDCPGVSYTQILTANPGDLDYGDICYAWYNFFDHWFPSLAGIETDDYYAPLETDTHLNATKSGFANFLAVCGTVVSGLFAIKALDESFKRIQDSFSDTPQDILPGKKNKLVNAVVIPLSMIQAVNRSAGNAMLAYVLMQEYNVHPALQWSVVASSTLTSSMTYFMNFDDAYSQLPGNLIALYTQGKNIILSQMNADYIPTHSAFVKCETMIKQANTMQDAIAVANIDVLKELS